MKSWLAIIRKFFNKHLWLVPALIIVLGLFFRTWQIQNVKVDFDQVQILENAHEILQGDFTLIGPRTGPASMFTGPLIYYFSVPFVALFGEWGAVMLVPLCLSLITGVSFFFLTQHYFDRRRGILITTLWAISPLLVSLDRVFWNPDLTLLATNLLFFPLLSDKRDRWQKFLIFVGAFLTYQAHFSGFALIALALILSIFKQKSWRLSLTIVSGFIFSLIPTLLFDLRNDFLNVRGILDFVGNSSDSGENFFISLGKNLFALLQLWGNLFFFRLNEIFSFSVGLVLLIGSIFFLRREKYWWWVVIWLSIIALFYAFYHGNKPEYYFLIAVPIFLWLTASLLVKLKIKFLWAIFLILFIVSSRINYLSVSDSSNSSIANLRNVQEFLAKNPVQDLIIDLKFGTDYGWQYFKKQINFAENGAIYHLADNYGFTRQYAKKINNLILWQDLRLENYNYEEGSSYLIGVPQAYTLEKVNDDAFAIKTEDTEVAILNVQKSICEATEFAEERIWQIEDYCLQLSVGPNSPTEILELPIQLLP